MELTPKAAEDRRVCVKWEGEGRLLSSFPGACGSRRGSGTQYPLAPSFFAAVKLWVVSFPKDLKVVFDIFPEFAS